MLEHVEEGLIRQRVEIDERQCGFMSGCGTIDAICIVRQLQVVMGNRFEITIDYRFTIGNTKPTSYRLYNRLICLFKTTSPIMVKYNQLKYPIKERHLKGIEFSC